MSTAPRAHQPLGEDLHRWLAAQADALGVDPAVVDVAAVLDLARDVSHGLARPAVPVTAYLVGYALGAAGADRDAAGAVVARVAAAARAWDGPDQGAR